MNLKRKKAQEKIKDKISKIKYKEEDFFIFKIIRFRIFYILFLIFYFIAQWSL
jgi:hypothetical protein